MKKLKLISLLLVLAILAGFNSCKDDRDDNDNNTGTSPTVYKMSFSGKVYDEYHNGLNGVEITIGNKTVTTDWSGTFLFQNINVPSDRYVITFKKDGYFDNARTGKVQSGSAVTLDLSMHSTSNNDTYTNRITLDPATGGQIDIGTYASIRFPAGVQFVDENGNAYSGNVIVAAMYNDPTSDDFTRFVPGGDQVGKTEAGEEKYLSAFGGLSVMLTDNNGNKVEISSSSDSLPIISTTIPSLLLPYAPDSIDRWYNGSNGNMAYAAQRGSGKKNGTKYVAACEHFSAWTFQQAISDYATVKGQVTDCNNEGIPGVRVQVGQTYCITDANGNYSAHVPAGVSGLTVFVDDIDYFGSGTSIETLTALSANEEKTVNLQLDCQGVVTGKLVDCNGNGIAGSISSYSANGVVYTTNGNFKIIIPSSSYSVSLTLKSGDYTRSVYYDNITLPYNAGEILMCPAPPNSNYITFHDTTITPLDEPSASNFNGNISIDISDENNNYSYITIQDYNGVGDYTVGLNESQVSVSFDSNYYEGVSGTITVQTDNGVGKRMWGTINAQTSAGETITGKFNIIHPDSSGTK